MLGIQVDKETGVAYLYTCLPVYSLSQVYHHKILYTHAAQRKLYDPTI